MNKTIKLIIMGLSSVLLIGIGINIAQILGKTVYIPFFPNVVDAALMIASGIALVAYMLIETKRELDKYFKGCKQP